MNSDGHFHIFGPFDRYPMSPGRTYTPPPEPELPQDQCLEWVPDPAIRQKVLVDNVARLNGF